MAAIDVPPIPAELLVDTVVVTEASSATAFKAEDGATHTFNHVLVQPVEQEKANSGADATQVVGNYLMFVDAKNSSNEDRYAIKTGDIVEYDGKPRKVMQVSAMKALLSTPHHWEVILQ